MYAEIEAHGDAAGVRYKWLKTGQPGYGKTSNITWTFEQFLVNGAGEVVARCPPMTTPEQVAEVLPEYM